MRIVLPLLLAALLGWVLVRHFLRTPPADLARQLKLAAGGGLILVGAGMLALRQFALAAPVALAGFMLLRRNMRVGRMQAPSSQSSNVRSAGLEMSLDHETGEMDGEVLAGRHAGRMLSAMTLPELMQMAEDVRDDPDSLRLLEGYLDRAHPGWRDDIHADDARRHSAPPAAGGMSTQEAYEILGLAADAGDAEVRAAHRRLMKQVHPDRGGSAALAARINEAKERILGQHR